VWRQRPPPELGFGGGLLAFGPEDPDPEPLRCVESLRPVVLFGLLTSLPFDGATVELLDSLDMSAGAPLFVSVFGEGTACAVGALFAGF